MITARITPYGYCHCGCGKKTTISKTTTKSKGLYAGEPATYLAGHRRPTRCQLRYKYDKRIGYGYCHCGCGQKTNIAKQTLRLAGTVKGKPMHFINGHGNRNRGPNYIVDEETGCWNWNKRKNNYGYGVIRDRVAHKVVWEEKNGPVPDGLELDHLCRNRLCVNPDHLEPVTHTENMRRGNSTKLTVGEVRIIKILLSTMSHRKIAAMFGLHHFTIGNISTGKTWKDVFPVM